MCRIGSHRRVPVRVTGGMVLLPLAGLSVGSTSESIGMRLTPVCLRRSGGRAIASAASVSVSPYSAGQCRAARWSGFLTAPFTIDVEIGAMSLSSMFAHARSAVLSRQYQPSGAALERAALAVNGVWWSRLSAPGCASRVHRAGGGTDWLRSPARTVAVGNVD